ncbi:MAG: tetratricopeptide repeat protein [Candidatus Cloacimonetes bacterium]|nr:tetratricopeptide repeat protein [Candidatus Cloacimonadota bacterium]
MKRFVLIFLVMIMVISLSAESALTRSYNYEYNYQYTAAIEAMQSLIEASPKDVFYNLRLGWLYSLNGDYANSEKYYTTANKLDKCLEAQEGLLNVAYATGQWEKVILLSDEIIKKYPQNTTVLFKKGYAFFAKKEWDKAAKMFSTVINIYPYNLDSRCYLLACQLYSGDMMNAKKSYEFIKRYSPTCAYLEEYEASLK